MLYEVITNDRQQHHPLGHAEKTTGNPVEPAKKDQLDEPREQVAEDGEEDDRGQKVV